MKKNFLFSVGLLMALFALVSCGGEKKSDQKSVPFSCKGEEKCEAASPANGHEYIDLGLPSGVMWATCNVGATKPEDFGGRYAWGEILEKDEYSWVTYKLCARTATTINKYCDNSYYGRVDNKTILDPEDDVAHVKWGGDWRMPTEADFDELRARCKWKWTSVNGVYGYNVTGPSGDSIFLPATAQDNFNGYYWSASLCGSKNDEAILFNFAQIDDRYCNDNTRSRQFGYSVRPVIELQRGNIIADNGELIVSTLPKYRLKFDFQYYNPNDEEDTKKINAMRDSIWDKHLHELCVGMNEILPGTSVKELEKRFRYGLKNRKGGYEPYRDCISYLQYKEIQKLPIINLGKKYSGCYTEELIERNNMIGNAGNSTFGVARIAEIDGKRIEELTGLEKKYNRYLKGEAGVGTRAKVGGKWITTHERKIPKDGYDVQTTLNSQMMEICQTELGKLLKDSTLAAGWAILMETKTGDIKAIVNLAQNDKGEYTETIGEKKIRFGLKDIPVQKNLALCERFEPGSIFKTVAMTAILADGKLTTKDSVNAYKTHNFNGHQVTDLMYRDNGTGKYSMKDALMYSSNTSMVQYIRKAYLNCPEQYTNTLYRFGLGQNYNLVDKEVTPYIKRPGSKDWDGRSLNSMSYGYAIEMTAINMVAFYNTIANGGRQMQPRLVKAILNNGKVVEEFPTKVINEQLFPKSVADDITYMLTEVVNGKSIIVNKKDWRYGQYDGTGKQARSELMTIAGKSGTAEQYDGGKDKLLSFCGFFPAEAPEYTLIVQIMYDEELDKRAKKNNLGGGNTAGVVFKNIAEKIMGNRMVQPVEAPKQVLDTPPPPVQTVAPTPEEPKIEQPKKPERIEEETCKDADNSIAKASNKGRKMSKARNTKTKNGSTGSADGNSSTGLKNDVGFGVSFGFEGREVIGGLVKPEYTEQDDAIVVVDIIVNPDGDVVSAEINRKKTICANNALRENARRAAIQTKFNKVDSKENQRGSITYKFEILD